MRQTGFKHSYTLQHTHLLTHLNWNTFLHKWVGDLVLGLKTTQVEITTTDIDIGIDIDIDIDINSTWRRISCIDKS